MQSKIRVYESGRTEQVISCFCILIYTGVLVSSPRSPLIVVKETSCYRSYFRSMIQICHQNQLQRRLFMTYHPRMQILGKRMPDKMTYQKILHECDHHWYVLAVDFQYFFFFILKTCSLLVLVFKYRILICLCQFWGLPVYLISYQPTGRAIQVETGYGERLPSIDTRPPRIRDSDAIIEVSRE